MQAVTTIGLDIAKSVFQIHGVDAAGNVIVRRRLKRRYVLSFFQKLPPCLVGIEACASSHHWSRELQALGHTVRLMPPAYVRPYVKRQKNDAADAEAICEAVTRANMRFVPTKTPEQQSCLMLHRTRHLFIRQQTAVINAIRAHLAEFGIVAPVGRNGVEQLLDVVADASDKRLPEIARACLLALGAQLRTLKAQILNFDRQIMAWHRSNEASKRLDEIPGVGPALATALVASVADPEGFPIWAEFFGLDRTRAEATLERGQGQAWQYQQTGRSLSAQPVHGGRAGRHSLCQDPWHQTSALAYGIVGAAAHQGGRDRACQQDRKNGVGHAGQG
jgi:transposase